ncbi:ribosome small subunit-dependent GTPase A [Desulforhopalus singaporensis]|uniref:Small ribosomal subunit biogenesis GTPase RsgA n=1 Tax=Desulforhopalus singaporensis TaxID=91360 RepID=A0A1H0LXC9_9BACT|nr:ribosome small subunit-dependent GTPase A [Desulforhopalus singaporensis]SDO72858.1 ribosome biogenesis GTPase [Desulforhopalus singaporensis]
MHNRDKNNLKRKGVIVAHYGVAVEVLFNDTGERSTVRVKRNSGHVVGDNVEVKGELLNRQRRFSELSRMDTRGGIHVVGANLDVLCIVITCEPLPPPGFTDRAIVASRAAGLTPILVVNKSDLTCFMEYFQDIKRSYSGSVTIFSVSAETGSNLDQLKEFFKEGHRGVFVGPTGVGKSSILNRLIPHLNLSTGEISETKKRGRHTTTVSTLHLLEGGGELVDSPGFNDFGLVDTSINELAAFFPGFEKKVANSCRFRDCRHRDEPGCAVTDLLEQKQISEERYATYLNLLTELEMIDSDPKYRERRNRRKK